MSTQRFLYETTKFLVKLSVKNRARSRVRISELRGLRKNLSQIYFFQNLIIFSQKHDFPGASIFHKSGAHFCIIFHIDKSTKMWYNKCVRKRGNEYV